MSEAAAPAEYGVVVIGGGQAGLAVGYHLARQGRKFVILEREHDVAPAWCDRWDSLTLFTPRAYDSLPGLEFPGDPDGYPTRDEVVAYLQRYAAHFDLPIRLGTAAKRITREGDRFVIDIGAGAIVADQVVVATGPFQEPRVPKFAGDLAPGVVHMHSTSYRGPSDLPGDRVLVVGGGNTGYQLAHELAATRETHLAVGSRQIPFPQRFLGRDLFWWLAKTKLIEKSVETKFGKRMSQKDTLVGSKPSRTRKRGVVMHGRATAASGRTVTFEDGETLDVDGVLWATGFRSDYGWIHLPLTDGDSRVKHTRGVTEIPGLYMLGLQWQYTRGSALLGFVKDDAAFIADQIAARADSAQPLQPAARAFTAATQGD